MAMRGWVRVPDGGLRIDGVGWAQGVTEVTDSGWYRLLREAGAEVIDEREYNDARLTPRTGDEDDAAVNAGYSGRGEDQARGPVRRRRARRGDRRAEAGS